MNAALTWTELGWERPFAAWALLVPPAFLLLVRLARRPPEVVIGTLALWDEPARVSPPGARARPRLPLWALACAMALLLAALAWLGPRTGRAEARLWTALVDLSPSMQLEAGAGKRLAVALARASAWLAEHAGPGDRVRWIAAERPELELAHGTSPDPAWLRPRPGGEAEPDWELHDHPGTLWITDRPPSVARAHAGLFASGGAAVEGAIAIDGRETVLWERGALRTVPTSAPPAVVVEEPAGLALPEVLARFLAAWSEARGFTLAHEPDARAVLVVRLEASALDVPLELARDGWSALGRGGFAGAPAAESATEDWLVGTDASGASRAAVRMGRGLVEVGLRELSEPAGDPARFALSWGRLLDAVLLPPEGVLPLAERLAAGEARSEPGELPPASASSSARLGPELDSALALGAALCALLALFLRPRT